MTGTRLRSRDPSVTRECDRAQCLPRPKGGKTSELGADCEQKSMEPADVDLLGGLLEQASINLKPQDFKHYGSARRLYHFDVKQATSY